MAATSAAPIRRHAKRTRSKRAGRGRPSAGGIKTWRRKGDDVGFAIRFRDQYGTRQHVRCGLASEGWSRERAQVLLDDFLDQVERRIYVPPPATPLEENEADPYFCDFASRSGADVRRLSLTRLLLMTDHAFLHRVAALAELPMVQAVSLGGSRAQGTAGPDSDWDLGIYYRGAFDPQTLREVGWQGEVYGIGDWGGGVFNGGAWLSIEGRKVDVHYRDLDVVEAQVDRAARGEFDIEPLMFHMAGIPTYLVVAELAIGRVLHGELPGVERYPDALREAARHRWAGMGELTLSYAERNHAPSGRVTPCIGLLAVAASQYAHAILAARGEWITNEKRLLDAAGLAAIDMLAAETSDDPSSLADLIDRARRLARQTLEGETPG